MEQWTEAKNIKGAKLEYSDFLTRAIDIKGEITKQSVEQVFKHFDTENKGKITLNGLEAAMKKQGKDYSANELLSMMNEVDSTKHDSGNKQFKVSTETLRRRESSIEEESEEKRVSISFNTFYDYICSQARSSKSLIEPGESAEELEMVCERTGSLSDTELSMAHSIDQSTSDFLN